MGHNEKTPKTESINPIDDTPSNKTIGLTWAFASLFLDIIEVLVLSEIIFFDSFRSGLGQGWGLLEYYLMVMIGATIGQAIGIYMVSKLHWYRIGGIFQIVASSTQLIKVDGIIGVIGGLKAWRYGNALAKGQPPVPEVVSTTSVTQ